MSPGALYDAMHTWTVLYLELDISIRLYSLTVQYPQNTEPVSSQSCGQANSVKPVVSRLFVWLQLQCGPAVDRVEVELPLSTVMLKTQTATVMEVERKHLPKWHMVDLYRESTVVCDGRQHWSLLWLFQAVDYREACNSDISVSGVECCQQSNSDWSFSISRLSATEKNKLYEMP